MIGPLEVLNDVIKRLDSVNVPYFLVGSLAAMFYSRPRFTNDIDLLKKTEFYGSEFARRQKIEITPKNFVYIASAEDIIIKKLDFYRERGSEKHLQDIREILAEIQIDKIYTQKWIDYFGLSAQWDEVSS